MDRMSMAIKREVVVTTNSIGWHHILRIAEQLVATKEKTALAENDESKIIGLQRKAQAAREFLDEFIRQIEITRQPDSAPEENIVFNEVAY